LFALIYKEFVLIDKNTKTVTAVWQGHEQPIHQSINTKGKNDELTPASLAELKGRYHPTNWQILEKKCV
jgi:hypothetical protein